MAIDLDVHGNTKPLEAAVQAAVNRIRRQPIKITVDDKGATQPLGNMKRGADEFTKSMEAANARILAFGASMAIINGVGNAFKGMVKNLVEVEKALADINVVMGLSAQNLDKFSDGLFKVAKETGAAFRVAADAATEYARQGLGVEESLKRTRDALVLTRLTGMDSAEAVKSLTAAMNTYGNQIKDTTQLVSKFAAVDVKFAVSAEDFADAISRTGQSAKTAGVSIDELVGIVTSAQQQTARGGAVIGNALKTIFTKTGRTDTLNQLENLGIAVRDLEGNTLGAKRILSDLANTFDKLSEAQKAQITQTMGGLFHINILKAVLSDAAKQNGIMAEATRISAGATDEAIEKNEELRKTMSAVATETGLAIKQVSAQIGEIAIAPGMEKILNSVKSLAEGLSGVLGDGETTGSSFATGFLKGIGNVITGPGLVVLAGVFFKLFGQALKFTKESLTSLVGVTTEKQKQKAIQTSLVALFGQNAALNKEMLRTDIGRTEKEKIILGLLKAQVVEANALNKLTAGMAGTLYRKGYGANLTPIGKKASGHIPNFAHPERAQAAQGGYAAGSIRSMNMPGEGPVIYNSAETVKNFAGFKQPAIMPPQSSKAGKNYQQAFGNIHGFDPYAAGGYIPNYAVDIYSKRTVLDKNRGHSERLTLQQAIQRKGISSQQINQVWGAGASASFSSQMKKQRKKEGQVSRSSAAMLVPPEGYMRPTASYAPRGKKSLSWPVYKLSFNESKNQPNLEREVEGAAKNIGTKYSNAISQGLGNKDPISKGEFTNFLTKAKGSQGAIGAAVGSIFEAAANTALRYSAESSDEGGDFDIRGGSRLKELSKVFHGFPAGMRLADYKNSDSQGNRISFYNKLIKEKTAAEGYIPNFADPLSDAIGREKAAGVPVSQIRVGSHGALMSKGNPLGLGVTNTHDEPNGLRDVFGANGFVPNYAAQFQEGDFDKGSWTQNRKYLNKANRMLASWTSKLEEGLISKQQYNKYIKMASRSTNDQTKVSKRVIAESKKYTTSLGRAAASVSKLTSGFSSGYQKTFLGKGAKALSSRMGGNFGITAMMGLPMAAGFLQSGGAEKGGASYKTGGALTGASTGAMMGMAIAPLLGPFGPLAIGLGAVAGGIKGWVDASEENTKALKEKREREETARGQAFTSGISKAIAGIDVKSIKDILRDYGKTSKDGGIGAIPALEKIVRRLPDDIQIKAQSEEEKEYFGIKGEKKITYGKKELLGRLTTEGRGGSVTDANKVVPQLTNILGNLLADAEATGKSDKKSKDTAIRQLNIRLASIKIQGAINDNLNRIKESSMMSQMNFKWIEAFGYTGNELVKSQITYAKTLSGAANDLEQKTEELKGKTMEGILGGLTSSENQQYIKDFLSGIGEDGGIQALQGIPESIREEFEKLSKKTGVVDLTQALTGLNYEELIAVLDAMSESNNGIKMIRDRIVASHENEQQKLKNNYDLTTKTAEENKKLNNAIGKRVELYKALNREAEYQDRFRDLDNQKTEANNQLSDLRWKNANRYATELAIANRELKELQRNSSQDLARKEQEMTIEAVDRLISKYKELGLTIDEDKISKIRGKGKLPDVSEFIKEESKGLGNRESFDQQFFQAERMKIMHQITFEKEGSDEYNELLEQQVALERFREMSTGEQKSALMEIFKAENHQLIQKEELLDTEEKITQEKIKQKKESLDTSFGGGFKKGMSDMKSQVEMMDYELGKRIPTAFADGLTNALTDAINGTKSIKEGLMDAAVSFLSMLQQAMMQKLVYQSMGAIGFSGGGNVRKYSKGGGVPAMVSNGEYVMSRDAVNKYGGSFMHGINAGGQIPGYSSGGSISSAEGGIAASLGKRKAEADKKLRRDVVSNLLAKGKIRRESDYSGPTESGSALAENFGGGQGFDSGRLYQRKAMSAAFYAQSGNVGLAEDASAMQAILSEEERVRQEIKAAREAKKAKRRQLFGMILSTALMAGLSSYGSSASPSVESLGRDVGLSAAPELAKSQFFESNLSTSFPASNSFDIPKTGGYNSLVNKTFGSTPQDRMVTGFYTKYLGGPIRKYASGGHIAGKSGIDQIPAMLSEGEYVIRASSARQIGRPMLDRINAGKFNEGGPVSEIAGSSETESTGGNTNNINISINMERGSSVEQQENKSSNKNPEKKSQTNEGQSMLAERIKQQVVSVIIEEQRPGGLLSD